ncbi:MAG: Calx-beta domain-containing protein [Thermoanaerobaculia bacterium]
MSMRNGRTWKMGTQAAALALAGWSFATAALASGPGSVKFDEASVSVAESSGTASLTIERSHGDSGAISVDVASSDGTATAGSDYQAVATTVSWADGDEAPKVVQVTIVDDGDAEGAETIQLTLSNPTGGATIEDGRGSSTVTIEANDGGAGGGGGGDDGGGGGGGGGGEDNAHGVFKFDERSFMTNEGVGVAVITVERSHGEQGAASVDFATSAGTAVSPDDYQDLAGTLSWADGEEGIKSFSIAIVADGVAEPNETVDLTLSNPTGGAGIDPDRGTAVLTILDAGGTGDDGGGDDSGDPGTIRFDEPSFEVIEGEVSAVITVERSHGSHGAVSVDYATSDGSASSGTDYQSASGTLSWANGDESAKTFVVPILGDDLAEGNETVNLALSNVTGGATLDPERDSSTLSILDDDGSQQPCSPDDSTLCLEDDRFSVQVTFRTAQGTTGAGHVSPLSGNSGTVWFFDPSNAEVLVKILDACGFPGAPSFWVFYAATTNVDFTLRVTDRHTGLTKEYKNLLGQIAPPVQDVATFKTCN